MQSKSNETDVCVIIPKRLSPLEYRLQKHLERKMVSERTPLLQVLPDFVTPGAHSVPYRHIRVGITAPGVFGKQFVKRVQPSDLIFVEGYRYPVVAGYDLNE